MKKRNQYHSPLTAEELLEYAEQIRGCATIETGFEHQAVLKIRAMNWFRNLDNITMLQLYADGMEKAAAEK